MICHSSFVPFFVGVAWLRSRVIIGGVQLYDAVTSFFSGVRVFLYSGEVHQQATAITLLHEFAGDDGSRPFAGLALGDSTLFGTTFDGGDSDAGTVFSLNTDGTGFTMLHEFAGGDGREPHAGLTLSGSTLFGTTVAGGDNDAGTVFSLVVPEPGGLVLMLTGLCVMCLCRAIRLGNCAN